MLTKGQGRNLREDPCVRILREGKEPSKVGVVTRKGGLQERREALQRGWGQVVSDVDKSTFAVTVRSLSSFS